MLMRLHANAATTPRVRAYIRASSASAAQLARELGISETTARRWKRRGDTCDRSSAPRVLATRFSAEEEAIAVELRVGVGLSLDDALEVMRRCLRPDISRSALHRCLARHHVAARPARAPEPKGRFDAQPFGYVHIDLKHLPRLGGARAYAFVAVERTTRFAHVEIIAERSAQTVAACLQRFLAAFGYPVHTILTDNGSEFTDRFGDARWRKRERGTGRHPFDRLCAARGVVHRLTRPYRPQTNGLADPRVKPKGDGFNRRLAEAVAVAPDRKAPSKNRFANPQERDAFLLTFVRDYNRTRLRCLDDKAPAEALANLPGHNTFAGMSGVR